MSCRARAEGIENGTRARGLRPRAFCAPHALSRGRQSTGGKKGERTGKDSLAPCFSPLVTVSVMLRARVDREWTRARKVRRARGEVRARGCSRTMQKKKRMCKVGTQTQIGETCDGNHTCARVSWARWRPLPECSRRRVSRAAAGAAALERGSGRALARARAHHFRHHHISVKKLSNRGGSAVGGWDAKLENRN